MPRAKPASWRLKPVRRDIQAHLPDVCLASAREPELPSRLAPPKVTIAAILSGLFAIMSGSGTGSELMQRIAAPMLGGMITAPLLSMFVATAV